MSAADVIASVALNVRTSDATRQIDAFQNRLNGLKSAAASVGAAVAGAFAGSKFSTVGTELLNTAAHTQEIAGKFDSVFKDLSGEASKAVAELANNFNFSVVQAQESTSTMADIFQKFGLTAREALDFSVQLNKTAADVEAFTDCEGGLERVTHALTSALLGEREAAKMLGIVIREDDVKAQMAAEAANGLKFANANAAKASATLALIMRQTANAQGQVARESDNYSNKSRKLKARIEDLKSAFGEAFIAPASAVVDKLSALATRINNTSATTKKMIAFVGVGVPALAAFGAGVAAVAVALGNYRNIARIANGETAAETAAKLKDATASGTVTTATQAETTAKKANAAATNAAAAASALATEKAKAELAERLAMTKAILAENEARRAEARLNAAQANGAGLDELANLRRNAAFRRGRSTVASNAARRASANAAGLAGDAFRLTSGARSMGAAAKLAGGTRGAGVLGLVGSLPGLKQLKDLGAGLAKLVPVGGRVGVLLKGLTRFAGPIGLVVTALEGLKHGPEILEKTLNEWFPKIKDGFSSALKWAATTGAPAVVNWAKNLVVDGLTGAGQLIKRALGFKTEAQRAYELEKQLAEARAKTAARTAEAQAAEERRRKAAEALRDSVAANIANSERIGLASQSDDVRKYYEESKERQTAIEDAFAKISGADGLAEKTKLTGDWQTARVEAARFESGYRQKTELDDLTKRFEAALDEAKTDDDRAAIAAEFTREIDAIRNDEDRTLGDVAALLTRADNFIQRGNSANNDQARNQFYNDANEARTRAFELSAGIRSGEALEAFEDFAKTVRDTAKDAAENNAERAKGRANFNFQKSLDALRSDDYAGRVGLYRTRADELEQGLARIDDPDKRLEIEREIYSLRRSASDEEKTIANARKNDEKRRLSLMEGLAFGELKTPGDRLSFLNSQFAQADSDFANAQTNDERFDAIEKMRSARDSADSIIREAREQAKRDGGAIGPQTAITRGSSDAFKIENRLRQQYQNKMLAIGSATNSALAQIYRRLGEMNTGATSANTNAVLEVEA